MPKRIGLATDNTMSWQNILVIVLIVGVIGALYLWYARGQTPAVLPLSEGALPVGPTATAQTEFLALLRNLKTIKLDTTLFQDKVYQSLIDPGVTITIPNDRGRNNPFLPLSAGAGLR